MIRDSSFLSIEEIGLTFRVIDDAIMELFNSWLLVECFPVFLDVFWSARLIRLDALRT